jgi:YggT family protein
MIMNVLVFLLDTLFFCLISAALLRAWLNVSRISMVQQPGPFVMALTDWLVRPLRRGMPPTWQRSRWDSASLIAAALLALLQAFVWVGLGAWGLSHGMGVAMLWSVPVLVGKILLKTTLQGLLVLTLGLAVLSWVQPQSPAHAWLSRLLSPVLRPLSRRIPLVGGVDLSALVLVLLLQVGLMFLG